MLYTIKLFIGLVQGSLIHFFHKIKYLQYFIFAFTITHIPDETIRNTSAKAIKHDLKGKKNPHRNANPKM